MTLASSDQGWIAGIAGDGIVTVGDPRLKAPTKAVEDANDVKELLTAMVDRLRSLNGAGLAAPQVGVSAKVIVVEVRKTDVFPDRPESPLLQMINPVVTAGSEETEEDWEGCFSVPGLMGQVRRSRTITVNFVDEHGQDVREEYSGYVARVIQHEVDHLNGVEFLDRLTSPHTLTTVQNYIAHRRTRAS